MKLNVKTLIEAKACAPQVKLFKELFPDGAEVSEETAISVANKFDWDWAASNLLSASGREVYEEAEAPILKAYEEAEAPLLKAYKEAIAPLWEDYKEAIAPLLKAYEEAEAPLLKAYEEAEAPLLKAYREAKAQIFVRLYIKENS
jgi:hypothetical protein